MRSRMRSPSSDYREQSLKMHGMVCAKCGREFNHRNRQLLTVHHKDGNSRNNPRTAPTGKTSAFTATKTNTAGASWAITWAATTKCRVGTAHRKWRAKPAFYLPLSF